MKEFWIDQYTNRQDIDDITETLYCGDALRHKPHTTNVLMNEKIIHVIEYSEYAKLKKENEILKEALTDYAEHGARFDINPTQPMGDWAQVTVFYLEYLRRINNSVKNRAIETLKEAEALK